MTTAQDRARELSPIIRAFADGNKVEYRMRCPESNWYSVIDFHVFGDARMEFRIHPDAIRKPREIWVNEYPGRMGTRVCDTKESAKNCSNVFGIGQVLFREVIEPYKKAREFWISGSRHFQAEKNALEYSENCDSDCKPIHVREVLE
jgi:hypothetical protein